MKLNEESMGGCDVAAVQERTTILLAYRDSDHERLGRKYCDILSTHFPHVGPLEIIEWKFEMLACAGMDRIAAQDARRSRVIAIATSCGENLTREVRQAIRTWCSRPRTAPGMLVVILSECAGVSEAQWPEFEFLEKQTRRCGMQLIVYASGLTPENANAFYLPEARRVTPGALSIVEDLAESAVLC